MTMTARVDFDASAAAATERMAGQRLTSACFQASRNSAVGGRGLARLTLGAQCLRSPNSDQPLPGLRRRSSR